jgi:hypothetical protein
MKVKGKDGKEHEVGLYDVHILTPMNINQWLAAGDQGNQTARILISVFSQTFNQMNEKMNTANPAMCVCLDCQTKFNGKNTPMAFVIMLPAFPFTEDGTPHELAITSPICAKCSEREDLDEMLKKTWQKMGMFNCREIHRTPQ